ncbi:MAG: hypothetical protein ACSHX0_08035 [Akkermansiaceae bacterium]
MKKHPPLLHCILSLSTTLLICAEGIDKKKLASDYYSQGQTALQAGDLVKAKTSYQAVLKIYPGHPQAIRSLEKLSSLSKTYLADSTVAKLKSVIIPEFIVENVSLNEALDTLTTHIDTVSEKKVIINFLVLDPSRKLDSRKISINIKSVPADAILSYITEQARAKIKYDSHAVIISAR